jgi:hypothetical protein
MSTLLQPESPKSVWSTARHHVTLEGCFAVLYMEVIDNNCIFGTWTLGLRLIESECSERNTQTGIIETTFSYYQQL